MSLKIANNVTTKLAGSVGTADTQIPLLSGTGTQFPTIDNSDDWYPVTLISANGTREICKCVGRNVDVLTVERAQEGTAASSFTAGDRVDLRLTAGAIDFIVARAETANDRAQALEDAPAKVLKSGDTMTGPLLVTDTTNTATYPADGNVSGPGVPEGNIAALHTALQSAIGTKQADLGYDPVNKAGDTMTGALEVTDGTSTATYPADGDVNGPAIGGSLSDALAAKSNVGDTSGVTTALGTTGQVSIFNGSTVSVPAGYVVVGVNVGGGDRPWISLRYGRVSNG